MKPAVAVLAGIVAAVTVVSVAAAGSTAKQRVAIETNVYPRHAFLFLPQSGALTPDSGSVPKVPEGEGREVVRDGQRVSVHNVTWTLKGKRGTLSIRERTEWVFVGEDGNSDRIEDAVAFGTWTVVRGTGQYAGVTGGGRSAHAGLGRTWNARYDGFLAGS